MNTLLQNRKGIKHFATCCLSFAVGITALTLSARGAQAQLGADQDRRYDQNTYLASHNSFANSQQDYKLDTANQSRSITQQLEDGVRCLLEDIYLVRQRKHLGQWQSEIYFGNVTTPSSGFRGKDLQLVVAHKPDSIVAGYKLLNGWSWSNVPFRNFTDDMAQLKTWMDAHPTQIVTIVLESYVKLPILNSQFYFVGLDNRIFYPDRPNPGFAAPDGSDWDVRIWGWPTLRQMADHGKTLVVFSSRGRQVGDLGRNDGMAYQWNSMVENVYGDNSLNSSSSAAARSESSALTELRCPLFFMNCFPSYTTKGPNYTDTEVSWLGYWNYSSRNSANTLELIGYNNSASALRYPNFLAVDFTNKGNDGGPAAAAAYFNYGWSLAPRVTGTIQSNIAPNAAGWYKNPPIVTLSGAGTYPNGESVPMRSIIRNAIETDGSWTSRINPAPYVATYTQGIWSATFTALAGDDVYGRSDAQKYTIKVDTTRPVTTASVSGHTVTLTATDNLSGVQAKRYNIDGGVMQTYVGPITVPGSGTHYVKFYSTDVAGNEESIKVVWLNL